MPITPLVKSALAVAVAANIETSNGVMHVVDTVMLPN
jgi:uncharacterized surface protein with fasciclin (FAS1) repeats